MTARTIEKLGRAADQAMCSREVAEDLRELVTSSIRSGLSVDALRNVLDTWVDTYRRREREAVRAFADQVQRSATEREFPELARCPR